MSKQKLRTLRHVEYCNANINLVVASDITDISGDVHILSTKLRFELPEHLEANFTRKQRDQLPESGLPGFFYRTNGFPSHSRVLHLAIAPRWDAGWDKNELPQELRTAQLIKRERDQKGLPLESGERAEIRRRKFRQKEAYDALGAMYQTSCSLDQIEPKREVVITRLGSGPVGNYWGKRGQYIWPAEVEANIAFNKIRWSCKHPIAHADATNNDGNYQWPSEVDSSWTALTIRGDEEDAVGRPAKRVEADFYVQNDITLLLDAGESVKTQKAFVEQFESIFPNDELYGDRRLSSANEKATRDSDTDYTSDCASNDGSAGDDENDPKDPKDPKDPAFPIFPYVPAQHRLPTENMEDGIDQTDTGASDDISDIDNVEETIENAAEIYPDADNADIPSEMAIEDESESTGLPVHAEDGSVDDSLKNGERFPIQIEIDLHSHHAAARDTSWQRYNVNSERERGVTAARLSNDILMQGWIDQQKQKKQEELPPIDNAPQEAPSDVDQDEEMEGTTINGPPQAQIDGGPGKTPSERRRRLPRAERFQLSGTYFAIRDGIVDDTEQDPLPSLPRRQQRDSALPLPVVSKDPYGPSSRLPRSRLPTPHGSLSYVENSFVPLDLRIPHRAWFNKLKQHPSQQRPLMGRKRPKSSFGGGLLLPLPGTEMAKHKHPIVASPRMRRVMTSIARSVGHRLPFPKDRMAKDPGTPTVVPRPEHVQAEQPWMFDAEKRRKFAGGGWLTYEDDIERRIRNLDPDLPPQRGWQKPERGWDDGVKDSEGPENEEGWPIPPEKELTPIDDDKKRPWDSDSDNGRMPWVSDSEDDEKEVKSDHGEDRASAKEKTNVGGNVEVEDSERKVEIEKEDEPEESENEIEDPGKDISEGEEEDAETGAKEDGVVEDEDPEPEVRENEEEPGKDDEVVSEDEEESSGNEDEVPEGSSEEEDTVEADSEASENETDNKVDDDNTGSGEEPEPPTPHSSPNSNKRPRPTSKPKSDGDDGSSSSDDEQPPHQKPKTSPDPKEKDYDPKDSEESEDEEIIEVEEPEELGPERILIGTRHACRSPTKKQGQCKRIVVKTLRCGWHKDIP